MPEAIDRFLAKTHIPSDRQRCWTWLGATRGSRDKRGCFWNGAKNEDAARWMFRHTHPSLNMTSRVVMHRCDNPLCVNPDHLKLGTQADNVADMMNKSRSHHHTRPDVNLAAAVKANQTMARNPGLRPRGERHGKAKLSDEARELIGSSQETTAVLAARYGVHRTVIQRIRAIALCAAALRARADHLQSEGNR